MLMWKSHQDPSKGIIFTCTCIGTLSTSCKGICSCYENLGYMCVSRVGLGMQLIFKENFLEKSNSVSVLEGKGIMV
jgi:hypothetical protein